MLRYLSDLTSQWFDKPIQYTVLTPSMATIGHHTRRYYNTIGCVPYAVPFLPVTYSFCDGKPVPPTLVFSVYPMNLALTSR